MINNIFALLFWQGAFLYFTFDMYILQQNISFANI